MYLYIYTCFCIWRVYIALPPCLVTQMFFCEVVSGLIAGLQKH